MIENILVAWLFSSCLFSAIVVLLGYRYQTAKLAWKQANARYLVDDLRPINLMEVFQVPRLAA